MKLAGKRILLLGASGGIGQAIARELDQQSTTLLLAGRDENRLQELRDSLTGSHQIIVADFNTAAGRNAIFDQCRDGGLDLYINAVGILDFQPYAEQDPDFIQKMLTTNLVSPMLLCHQLIPMLLEKAETAIVNIGSTFGSIGHPGFTAYCASKFGLRGFSEALQRELGDTGVRVYYLAPRATRTNLNPGSVTSLNAALGNSVDPPEKVAEAVMKVLRKGRRQVYMGWPERLFVRINGLFPDIVHRALTRKLPIIRQHFHHH